MAGSQSALGAAADKMILLLFVTFLVVVRSAVGSLASSASSSVVEEEVSGAHRKLGAERWLKQPPQQEQEQVQMNLDEKPTSAAHDAASGASQDSSMALRRRTAEQVLVGADSALQVSRRRLLAPSEALVLPRKSARGGGGGGYFGYGGSTTGGAGGEEVFVTNYEDSGVNTLRYFCGLTGPMVIKFQDDCTIELNSRVECTDDKTVDGSGHEVRITGWGLSANRVNNVVFKNLCIKDTRLDAITSRLSSNIVVEGCSFSGIKDGAVDVITHSSGVSILGNHFYGIQKPILAGNADSDKGDKDMKVTLAYNHFDNCGSRQPRVRHATVHVCANVYTKWGNYAIGASMGAKLLVENCFFHHGENDKINNLHEGENDGTVIEYRNNEYNGARLLLQALGSVSVAHSCPARSESSITSQAGVPYAC